NRVTLTAGGAFFLWSLASAWVSNDAPGFWRALWHPLWAAFGQSQGAISISPYRTIEGVAAFLGPACAFAIGALAMRDREDRDWAGRFIMVLCASYAILALTLAATAPEAFGGRLRATLGSPNAAATAFGAMALFLCALIFRAARGRLSGLHLQATGARYGWASLLQSAPITLAVLALTVACLLLTGSRGGLAAFAGAFLVLASLLRAPAAREKSEGRGLHLALLALVGLAGLLFIFGGSYVLSRIGSIEIDAENRRMMIDAHWRVFLERPLLGHGLNTFHELNAHAATPENYQALRRIGSAHNIFVQLLEEQGLIGAILFVLMLAPPLWRGLTASLSDRSGAEWAAAAIAAATLCLAHGAVDFGLQIPALGALFSFALGAFAAAADSRAANDDVKSAPKAAASFRFRTLDPSV
ncbi:MAG: O-antigen ligase family protein, partial [Hyphomonadaceae bacterium]